MSDERTAGQVQQIARLHVEVAALEARIVMAAEGLRRVAGLAAQLNDTVAEWAMMLGTAHQRANDPETIEKLILAIRSAGTPAANDDRSH